jgi:hypothetical protein
MTHSNSAGIAILAERYYEPTVRGAQAALSQCDWRRSRPFNRI